MTLPTPPVPDLARLKGQTKDEVISSLIQFYNTTGAPFNYMSGTRSIKASYRGFHSLKYLLAGCDKEHTDQGKKSNREIVEYAAPLAFGRTTQVFDLPSRKFAFGRDLYSSYRIPFFFVENKIVKLYYLQPRKGCGLTYDELCMVATIYKRHLLDTEFFGQAADVEFVDLSAMPGVKDRSLRDYSLAKLQLWSDERLADRLTLIAEALDYVKASDLVKPRRRRAAPIPPDMPLF
jgi:hypothetical protein